MTFHSHSTGRASLALALLVIAGVGRPAFACSECGCSLSADWSAQGFPDFAGVTASTRFEYSDSNDLRSGTGHADPAAFGVPADVELQQRTLTRTTWLGLDYVGRHGWAASVRAPLIARFHTTLAEGDTEISTSRASGLGDVRVVARYQRLAMYRGFALQAGLKLPTGSFNQTFAAGPQAGEPLDRGLQLGSGTTDLVVGASRFGRPGEHLGWFAQGLVVQPLGSRRGFVPATVTSANAGLRYLNRTSVTPQLQLNLRWDGREHGREADVPNSGGVRAYVSPGVTVELGQRGSAFLFVQLPVYRRLNGLQLEPDRVWSVGANWRL